MALEKRHRDRGLFEAVADELRRHPRAWPLAEAIETPASARLMIRRESRVLWQLCEFCIGQRSDGCHQLWDVYHGRGKDVMSEHNAILCKHDLLHRV